MRRIDRLILSALENPTEKENFLQRKKDAVSEKSTNVAERSDDSIHSAVTPSTSLVAEPKTINRENVMTMPPTPLLNPASISSSPLMLEQLLMLIKNDDADSPTAPLYSPLTPLIAASKIIQHKNEEDSPAAPLFQPLTPLTTAQKSIENKRSAENSSPIPAMSPSTLELYETLSGSCQSDYSRDTDSDYVPNSEEDSDNNIKNNNINLKVLHIPESDDDFGAPVRIVPTNTAVQHNAVVHNLNLKNEDIRIRTETPSTTFHGICDDTTLDLITNSDIEIDELNLIVKTQNDEQTGRPKKGRKRKHPDHTMAQKKSLKYANLPYHGKNKLIQPKKFKDYTCTCTRQCFLKVSREKRKEEFEKYITSGSYEAQLLFILNNVKEIPKARAYTTIKSTSSKSKPRQYRRNYAICEIDVCKDMFLNNFQISSKKIDVCLVKKRSGNAFKDKRGTKGGCNKKPEEDITFVKNIINALPKYESHYRREKSGDCQFLKPGMTVQKIYKIYSDELKKVYGTSKVPVSIQTVKRIFYDNFNLRCKPLKKDTCSKCDTLTHKIKNCTSADKKLQLVEEKNEHLKRAEDLRNQMNQDLLRAKNDKIFECLTYDLEKTLPLPRIPTNIVFYKRQLWLYNSGIHAGSNDVGYCNIWVEGEAGRGAQEVGSCLVRYIKNNLSHEVENLVLWSDCCGGQNRNIKIVLMLKVVLESHSSLKTITLKYLESGHTFLPNDTDFSKIEYQLKYHERIYTPEEYINVIKSCKKKNPLKVYKMKNTDFLSTSKIEKKIVNRKTFVTKCKVNWLKTKEILLKKDEMHIIYMKSIHGEFQPLNIEKKVRGKKLEISEEDFVLLWPNGKEIAQAKLDDLISMFDLIPKDCLDFYKSLKGKNVVEDVDGFDCQPDFDIVTEEDSEHNEED